MVNFIKNSNTHQHHHVRGRSAVHSHSVDQKALLFNKLFSTIYKSFRSAEAMYGLCNKGTRRERKKRSRLIIHGSVLIVRVRGFCGETIQWIRRHRLPRCMQQNQNPFHDVTCSKTDMGHEQFVAENLPNPRPATSVATRIETSLFLNCFKARSRSI
jgi:hypothetical protein